MIRPDVLFHELRTAAGGIKSITSMMQELGYRPEDVEHLITTAHFLSKAMIEVTEYYKKRYTSKMPDAPIIEETNIRYLVNHVVTIVRHSDIIGKVKIKLDIEDNVSTTIKTDKILLTGMLQNLVVNAVKFSGEEGEVLIHVRMKDKILSLDVEDNGIGISPANLEVIFEPYVFLTDDRYHGMGIGLANVRADADLLGADINVKSILHEGSVFTINLPLL